MGCISICASSPRVGRDPGSGARLTVCRCTGAANREQRKEYLVPSSGRGAGTRLIVWSDGPHAPPRYQVHGAPDLTSNRLILPAPSRLRPVRRCICSMLQRLTRSRFVFLTPPQSSASSSSRLSFPITGNSKAPLPPPHFSNTLAAQERRSTLPRTVRRPEGHHCPLSAVFPPSPAPSSPSINQHSPRRPDATENVAHLR